MPIHSANRSYLVRFTRKRRGSIVQKIEFSSVICDKVGGAYTIAVSIPEAAEPAAVHETVHVPNPEMPMTKILLIDDDDDFRALLRDELEAGGHQVTCLEGTDEGPETLARSPHDVVILDNIMPRMTGIEFLKASRKRGIKTPVILMTGNADSDTAIRAINLGASNM